MGVIRVADEVQRVIEQQVLEGRAPSAAAFVEEAVSRLVDDHHSEEQEVAEAALAGSADIAAGRFTTIATLDDERALRERWLSRLRGAERE